MYHIFFGRSNGKQKFIGSKRDKRKGPRLQRLNARKDIDYKIITGFEGDDLRTRSADFEKTSFRIEGTEGELDRVYRSLGISGPDDLGIPVAAWEARKTQGGRSSSDVSSTSQVNRVDYCVRVSELDVVSELADDVSEIVRVSGVDLSKIEEFPVNNHSNGGGGGGGGERGIKGVRPPVLIPPPDPMPISDNGVSNWYLLKSYAPQREKGYSSDDNDDGDNVDFGENEYAAPSESCSFTTNDDDSSSTTTENISPTVRTRSIDSSSIKNEPPSYISPNGRVRRIVTNWTKGKLLGRGSFGSVYEGIADGGFFLAVKEVSLLDQGVQGRQSIYQLEQEIALLSKFEHENIVQYYGTYKDESTLYIFLELASKGSLLNLYQQYNLRDAPASAYTRQILLGLKYLHDRNVVHRDIKCANILVDTSGTVKLADFGLAKATKLNDVQSCKGTAFWMAPEVVKGSKGYGLAADIWSLGCTVLEMLTGQLPYYPLECMQAVYRIGNSIPPDVPDSLSKDARDFILQCLQVTPSSRPTAAQLLDHPFVKGRLLSSSSELESPHNPR